MKRYNVIVGSASRNFLFDMITTLKKTPFIDRIFYFENGSSLIEYFQKERYVDIVLLDTFIQGSSIYEILDKLEEYPNLIKVVASDVYTPQLHAFLTSQGTTAVINKPNDPQALIRLFYNYICYVENSFSSNTGEEVKEDALEIEITRKMIEFNLKSDIKGFYYTKDALNYLIKEEQKEYFKTSSLYQKIASKNNTTSARVERAIRHLINTTYRRLDIEKTPNRDLAQLFKSGCASNKEFLLTMATIMKIVT